MRVSMKLHYGLMALLELTQHYGEGPISTSEIASRQGIPEPFLHQVLTTLNKAGFIRSRRGPQGGHVLSRDPAQISLGAIINALEGSQVPISCIVDLESCPRVLHCTIREVWQRIQEATQSILNTTSLAYLAQQGHASEGQAL